VVLFDHPLLPFLPQVELIEGSRDKEDSAVEGGREDGGGGKEEGQSQARLALLDVVEQAFVRSDTSINSPSSASGTPRTPNSNSSKSYPAAACYLSSVTGWDSSFVESIASIFRHSNHPVRSCPPLFLVRLSLVDPECLFHSALTVR